jgi:hypothetical protein
MPTIDSIILHNGLYRDNLHGKSGLDGVMNRARDGTAHIWEQSSKNSDFDLVGSSNTGIIYVSQIKALNALASVPGAIYSLIYNSETISVRFRTWEQPVIEHNPLGPREVMNDNDILTNVRIKLQEA